MARWRCIRPCPYLGTVWAEGAFVDLPDGVTPPSHFALVPDTHDAAPAHDDTPTTSVPPLTDTRADEGAPDSVPGAPSHGKRGRRGRR